MTLDDQIALLQGVKAGRKLQNRPCHEIRWETLSLSKNHHVHFDPMYEYRLAPEPRKCWVVWRGQKPIGVTDNYISQDNDDVVAMVEVMP